MHHSVVVAQEGIESARGIVDPTLHTLSNIRTRQFTSVCVYLHKGTHVPLFRTFLRGSLNYHSPLELIKVLFLCGAQSEEETVWPTTTCDILARS